MPRGQVIAIWPGFQDRALGVAIDVGSTTIAGHLADLERGEVLASAGVMNPQIRFGEDLMSRVSFAMLHDGGAAEMTADRAQPPWPTSWRTSPPRPARTPTTSSS